jgi:HSP20 family protein
MNESWFPTGGERNRDVEHFRGFKAQIDSLFEDWFGRSMGGVLAPRVDVAEDEKAVTLTAELPGVNEKDIDVSLVGDQLTIKGEKRSEHEEKKDVEGHVVHRTERSYGAFQRTITVPYRVDPNRVSADYRDRKEHRWANEGEGRQSGDAWYRHRSYAASDREKPPGQRPSEGQTVTCSLQWRPLEPTGMGTSNNKPI